MPLVTGHLLARHDLYFPANLATFPPEISSFTSRAISDTWAFAVKISDFKSRTPLWSHTIRLIRIAMNKIHWIYCGKWGGIGTLASCLRPSRKSRVNWAKKLQIWSIKTNLICRVAMHEAHWQSMTNRHPDDRFSTGSLETLELLLGLY